MTEQATFVAGGTVQAGGGYYIPRRADAQLSAACLAGEFAYVLSTRQVGKSSLMIRTAESLVERGIRPAIIDLTQIGTNVDSEQWYKGFLSELEMQLDLGTNVIEWWKKNAELGAAHRLTLFFKDVLLREIQEPIVVFVDEIDTTLSLGFTDDFFAAIRSTYNARSVNPEFKRLSFVLLGVAAPNDLIKDANRTPFNIGRQIELTDFTLEETLPLADGLGLPSDQGRRVLGWVLDWTGGHPYLTQQMCRLIVEENRSDWSKGQVDELVARFFLGEKSEQEKNLQFVRDMLTRPERARDVEGVLRTYLDVYKGRRVPDEERSPVVSHLKISGVVRSENGALKVRNKIYREVFNRKWIQDRLPVDWRKRFATIAVAAVLILLVLNVPLSIYAWQQKTEAEKSASLAESSAKIARMLANGEHQAREEADRLRREAEASVVREKTAREEAETQRSRAEKAAAQERIAKLTAERERQAAVSAAQRERAAKIEADRLRKDAEATAERERIAKEEADRLRAKAEESAKAEKQAHDEAKKLAQEVGRLNKQLSARNLAVQAELLTSQRNDQLQTSLMLAVESMKRLPNVSADRVLRAGLKSVTALGSSEVKKKEELPFKDEIHILAFSSDGRKLAVAEKDVVKLRTVAPNPDDFASPSQQTAKDISFSKVQDKQQVSKPSKPVPRQKAPIQSPPALDQEEILHANPIHKGPIVDIALDPKRNLLAVASKERVSIWDTNDGKVMHDSLYLGTDIHSIAYHPDGSKLAVSDQGVKILDVSWGRVTASVTRTDARKLAFSPDGYLLAAVEEKEVSIWELRNFRKIASLAHREGFEKEVNAVAFSPDGRRIATAGDDDYGYVWEIGKNEPVPILKLKHPSDVNDIAFSPDGRLIVTACDQQGVFLWDAASGKQIGDSLTDKDEVYRVAFQPGGSYLAAGGQGKQVVVWQVNQERQRKSEIEDVLFGQTGVQDVVFLSDDELAVGTTGTIDVLNVSSKRSLAAPLVSENSFAAISPDAGKMLHEVLVMDHEDKVGNYVLRDLNGNFETVGRIRIPDNYFGAAFFPRNTNQVLLVLQSSPLQLWDWKSNRLEELPDSGGWESIVASDFDQNNQRLLTVAVSPNGIALRAFTYDLSSRKTVNARNFNAGTDVVTDLKYSPDGTWFVIAGRDGIVRFFDSTTLEEINGNQIVKHDGAVNAVAFTPDGKYLATAGEDETARIWEIATRREIARFSHADDVSSVTFSQSGKYLATGCEDGTVHRYLWRPEDLIDLSCSRLSRPPFTEDEWNQYFEGEKFENYVPCPNQKAAGRQ